MSRLLPILLITGFGLGLNAAYAQNVDVQNDHTASQAQQAEQKGNQSDENRFREGKPQQSDADEGKTGREEMDQKRFDQGKPDQSDAAKSATDRGQSTKQN